MGGWGDKEKGRWGDKEKGSASILLAGHTYIASFPARTTITHYPLPITHYLLLITHYPTPYYQLPMPDTQSKIQNLKSKIRNPLRKNNLEGIYIYLYIDLTTTSNFFHLLILEVDRWVEFWTVELPQEVQVRLREQFLLLGV